MATKGEASASTKVDDRNIPVYVDDQITAGRKFLLKFGINANNMTKEEIVEKLDKIREARARSVEVLSRGPTLDGMDRILKKYIPKGYVGEFVLNTDIEIPRAEALGWEMVRDEKASKATATPSADNLVILGDCVLMMMPEEQYIAHKLVKMERIEARMKKSYVEQANEETGDWDIPVIEL